MKLCWAILALALCACSQHSPQPFASVAQVHRIVRPASRSPVRAVTEDVEAPVEFEMLRTDLGADHLGRSWKSEFCRHIGSDEWTATFACDVRGVASMNIGRLHCGHQPSARMEVWPTVSFIVLSHDSSWGSGIWSHCECWYTLDALNDPEDRVFYLEVSGHVVGWGPAYDRELTAKTSRATGAGVAIDVTATLDVMDDEYLLFQAHRRATYSWVPEQRRFLPTSQATDDAVRGMWDDGEDGLVLHELTELTAWFLGPNSYPEFVQGLLARAKLDATRNTLRELLSRRG